MEKEMYFVLVGGDLEIVLTHSIYITYEHPEHKVEQNMYDWL